MVVELFGDQVAGTPLNLPYRSLKVRDALRNQLVKPATGFVHVRLADGADRK
jgi:hypothetical protein